MPFELGARVGMRAQSLYSYFPSKHAIYDAMFAEAAAAFRDVNAADLSDLDDDPRRALRAAAERFFAFWTADTLRYQMLFQRPIPGFEPSAEAYAPAVEAYEAMRKRMARLGINDQDDLDLWTALLDGLTDQQISNDPGGDRWARLVGRAIDMWYDHVLAHHAEAGSR